MPFNNEQQFKIPFEEPKKEVADVSVLSEVSVLSGVEGEGESSGVPKEETKKPEPVAQIIELTEEQVKNRKEDLDELHEKHFN